MPGIYDYYQISNYGRVFHKYLNKFIKIAEDGSGNGYYFFMARTYNGSIPVSVHRTELMCFCPNPDWKNLQVNHIDGNPHNNFIGNLEWCTRSYNIRHSYEIGLHGLGEDNASSKIDNNTAIKICELLSTNQYTFDQIVDIVGNGATVSIVAAIKSREAWNFISKDYEFTSRPGRLFTEDQVRDLCRFFQFFNKGDLTVNDFCRKALDILGMDSSDRYVDTARKIYTRKYFTNIVKDYNF